jgi:signal peptidase I
MKQNKDKSKRASRREKKGAKELLSLGLKVYAFRQDRLPAVEARGLNLANEGLREALQERKVSSEKLEKKARILDEALRKSGGHYYHKKNWVENVEMLLVVAIVILGIRSFFIQPFIIPTNSMFPSFYGMKPYIYENETPPNIAERARDKLLFGASHYRLESESSGNLYLVLQNGTSHRYVQANFPNGRFFILPTMVREYTFEIGGKKHTLQVPAEFDMDQLLAKKFAGIDDLRDLPMVIAQDESIARGRMKLSDSRISKGDVPLAFDVLLGDALFVDRMSYNFIRPQSGDPIIFKTAGIDAFNRELNTEVRSLIGEDKYYIKRLAGEPGDTLEIRVPESIFTNGTDVRKGVPGILYRNGQPADAHRAIKENNQQAETFSKLPNQLNEEGFPAYRAEGLLTNRSLIKVPHRNASNNSTKKNGYFAMGDNSTDSLDSRAWGFVPENELIGRALFVYYPFTNRWGLK